MHDIVIRGGNIIDGTGKPAFAGDVAIAGGRIAAVGGKQGPAKREISYMQATLEALSEEMERDPAIFVMGEGIGKRGGNFRTTVGLYEKHGPVRLCDTSIAGLSNITSNSAAP